MLARHQQALNLFFILTRPVCGKFVSGAFKAIWKFVSPFVRALTQGSSGRYRGAEGIEMGWEYFIFFISVNKGPTRGGVSGRGSATN